MNYKDYKCFKIAERNYNLADYLFQNKRNYDWVVITLYYSALMYTKSFLKDIDVPDHRHPGTHVRWFAVIEKHFGPEIKGDFESLYKASRNLRYKEQYLNSIRQRDVKQYLEYFTNVKNVMVTELQK